MRVAVVVDVDGDPGVDFDRGLAADAATWHVDADVKLGLARDVGRNAVVGNLDAYSKSIWSTLYDVVVESRKSPSQLIMPSTTTV